MSRESKLITANVWNPQDTISHYEAFGWELLSINGSQITMSRETQNPVYSDLVKFQAIYEQTAAEYNRLQPPAKPVAPPKVSFKTCFISFICFVIPCAVYVTYKVLQNNKYKEEMQAYNTEYSRYTQKKKALADKMQATVLESRSVFFSKQA